MFCKHCGAQVDDEARFCTECGAPVERPVAPTPGSDQPPASEASRPPASAPAPNEPVVKKKRSKVPAIVAGLLAVAVAGAGGAFYFASLSGSSTSDASAPVAPATVKVDEDSFPDSGLRYFVSQTVDKDGDGEVTSEELAAVSEASIDGARDLSALGRTFPNLASLTVTGGQLTTLDVSDCPELESVDVSGEPIASLDVSSNPKLASLDVTGTQISTVDVSHNPDLSQIAVDDSTAVTGTDDTQVQEAWIATGVSQDNGHGLTMDYSVELDDSGRVATARYGYSRRMLTVNYSYDSKGRLVGVKDNEYTADTYSYNDSGQLTQYSTKYETRNASYENGLLSKITSGSKTLATYSYDSQGRLIKATEGSGGVYEYAYDDAGRLASESYTYQGKTPQVTTYTYDQDGHPTTITSTGSNISAYNGTVQATYDSEGRIATVDQSDLGIHETFTYDGNRNLAKVDATYKNGPGCSWTLSYKRSFIPKGQELTSKGLYLKPLLTSSGLAMDQSCFVDVDLKADAPGVPDAAYTDLQVQQYLYMQ